MKSTMLLVMFFCLPKNSPWFKSQLFWICGKGFGDTKTGFRLGYKDPWRNYKLNYSLELQIPCEVRCLVGTQNPLQNYLQKGLEHKGFPLLVLPQGTQGSFEKMKKSCVDWWRSKNINRDNRMIHQSSDPISCLNIKNIYVICTNLCIHVYFMCLYMCM